MAETVFDENYIMSTLKEFCENIELCGFEAYIVKKESPKLRRMSLDEQINENGDNFRTVLKNLFIDIIKERYLSEDVQYTDGHQLADNQNKYFYFEQGESFHPFKYLNDKKEIAEFEEDDLSSASGKVPETGRPSSMERTGPLEIHAFLSRFPSCLFVLRSGQ